MNAVVTQAQGSAAVVPLDQVERMALAMAKSGLFGIKTPDQALALMLVAQAEGMHPATAARDFHIINNRPALKADAMLARFLAAGGRVKWIEMSDSVVEAEFSHPAGGTVTVEWTPARAKQAGISNEMHRKYPRQMLRARVISEGIRTVFPGVAIGVYTPEEVVDMEPAQGSGSRAAPAAARPAAAPVVAVEAGPANDPSPELVKAAEAAAAKGLEAYGSFWNSISKADRRALNALHQRLKVEAGKVPAAETIIDAETGEVAA